MITRFSQEVIQQLGYYVYKLIDPRNGQVFYVGRGTGNRVFDHVKCAITYYDGVDDTSLDDPNKLRTIKEITNDGLEVIHVIQRWHMTKDEALEVEAALIDAYPGLTNIQSGHHAQYGVTNAEALERRLTLKEYEEPTDFKYMIIKVSEPWLNEMMIQFPSTYRYEATRYAWRNPPKNVDEYPYAFSVTDGIVREVYKIKEWYSVGDGSRDAFNGEVAEECIRERFVGKRIPGQYTKKGMASPVLRSKNEDRLCIQQMV